MKYLYIEYYESCWLIRRHRRSSSCLSQFESARYNHRDYTFEEMKNTKINGTVVQIMFFFVYLLCSRVWTTTTVATSGFCLRKVKGLQEVERQKKHFIFVQITFVVLMNIISSSAVVYFLRIQRCQLKRISVGKCASEKAPLRWPGFALSGKQLALRPTPHLAHTPHFSKSHKFAHHAHFCRNS